MSILRRKPHDEDGLAKKIILPKPIEIDVNRLKIDDKYQRNVDTSHVAKIRNHFDPDLFNSLTVCERDGDYYIVDGQHRFEAIKDKVKKVPCQVWTGLTYEQEVGKFDKLNSNRKALNASIRFHSMVQEGKPAAVKTAEIMRQYGYAYNRYNMSVWENTIGSPSRMMDILTRQGENVLRRILIINRRAWHGEKSSLRTQMLVALATLINDYPSIDDNRLIKVLSNISPHSVSGMAAAFVTAHNIGVVQGGSAKYVHIANAIKELYNKGLSKNSPKYLK